MGNEYLKTKITELLATAGFDETGEWLAVTVDPKDWLPLAQQLRHEEALQFDYLFCVTCIDWLLTPTGKNNISMVYHLSSTIFRHNVVIKCILNRDKPEIESVSHIWKTAEFHEREAYEMFGVDFLNHPDLRLLILPDGWEGRNPMRKDFEDPINMIKL